MRHKRLKLSTVFLLGLGLTGLNAQTMYVKEKNDTQTAYTLSEINKMTFSSGNINICNKTGSTDSYLLNNLRYLNFVNLIDGITDHLNGPCQLLIYPNPVKTELNIQLKGVENQALSVEILSITGRVIYYEVLQNHATIHKINLFGQPNGLYICRIISEETIQTEKIIKE